MILLYACPSEVKYVDYNYKMTIGLRAKWLPYCIENIKGANHVVLFGCSGWQASRSQAQLNKLYKWDGYPLVDMESEKVEKICRELGVKFTSIRYIIDFDRGKLLPFLFNGIARWYQHRRMQKKFNKYLENLK